MTSTRFHVDNITRRRRRRHRYRIATRTATNFRTPQSMLAELIYCRILMIFVSCY